MSDRTDYYAHAFFNILLAEGNSNEVTDELFRFARIVDGNDELRSTLADPHLPVERRQQIVVDLLGGKASPTTTSLVGLMIATGRITSLTDVVDRLLARTAAQDSRVIAQVRSAVPLDDDQKNRLAAALAKSTGKEVDIVVIVDPEVLGGLVTQIGDTVIDGSVRQRLSQLRESF